MRRPVLLVAIVLTLLLAGGTIWAPALAAPQAIQVQLRVLLNGESTSSPLA